ncbi:type II toxin-antitoxin system RelE/ParE family toxin [Sphingobium sp. 15-1]|uniref:type II toxin-antitoxin system RelE/ParE family toxin n=1 Tax=Sphingobium sp. 15-1 TaxID=2729616 RepID=UPI0021006A17|nr:type II toxin-antitoxin system RelE/ParE family toxin [Sphingobium sp. 15-1]
MRLHEHLGPVAPEQPRAWSSSSPARRNGCFDHLRIGETLEAYELREVHRIIVGSYEIAAGIIFILRPWRCRGNRSFESDG